MKEKYQIDTKENKVFLKEMRQDLLKFGEHFTSQEGSAY